MPIVTTIFRPNSLQADIAFNAGLGFRRATTGGVSSTTEEDIVAIRSNEMESDPWTGNSTIAIVAAARWIDAPGGNFNYRARTMMRFVLRSQVIDANSIVSGVTPTAEMWPLVSAARLKWFNGDPGGLQTVPTVITQSRLIVRIGRGLYVPTGANEEPFGRNTAEGGASFTAAASLGIVETIMEWANWAQPNRSEKTLNLSQAALDGFFRSITGSSNDYIDVAMRLEEEGVDGVNINRELGAWEPFPPTLEIDFDLDEGFFADVHAIAYDGNVIVSSPTGDVSPQAPDGDVSSTLLGGEISVGAPDGSVEASAPDGNVLPTAPDGVLEVSAPTGDITLTAPDGRVEAMAPDGIVRGNVNDGEAAVAGRSL